MFNSPILSRSNKQQQQQQQQQSSLNMLTTKHIIDEKSKTIEQLKIIIDELKLRHERKERELLKRIGILYNDLQQNKKKMAHLIYKHQQQKKTNNDTKSLQDFSTQTDENNLSLICINCSTQLLDTSQCNDEHITQLLSQLKLHSQNKIQEQQPKYYTLQPEEDIEYISTTSQPNLNQSLSSPALSTTDRSSTRSSCSHHHCSISTTKHNESSSSAYNTAESLPSSTYSDEIESLERVLNAASTMYTTHDNLQHTIKLQEELFRQHLRLRGITIDENHNEDNESSSSEHLYDNIDDETSDIEKQSKIYKNRLIQYRQKKSKQNIILSTDDDEQQEKIKILKQTKVRFIDQYHQIGKRRNLKSTSKTNLIKSTNTKRYHSNPIHKNLPLSSNMLTVTIT
ncbi:unnamed protein product [Rotaria sordida]|uniref:Uncharacterized protein n=1 Tax=Rotaria sordida TaxID=392033 RepID=A0A814AE00_9BILA|nr:unnamed protein product [Rotaria sordida]CAF0910885.1 unnamed protein product [Rotaria sordida]CAF3584556.1 unnamed protein product [Rotaria sordida]CAF3586533.1 unnamed protein product [Rotaria sordida]